MRGKKIAAFFLAGALSLLSLSACQSSSTDNTTSVGDKPASFIRLCDEEKSFSILAGQTVEIICDKSVGDKSYFWLELETDVPLVGYIYYENIENPNQKNTEKLFIEKHTREFTTFLDSFRVGALGAFDKKITKITLQNVDAKTGEVWIQSVGVTNRSYDKNQEIYISDGFLKMGTSLSIGGAIRHIEKLNEGVVEYIDEAGNVCIQPHTDPEKVETVSKEVNLVNIHDLGREIQQSYYSAVKEEHGYAPTEEVLYNADLLYNPVQAGSASGKQSQIIDYRYSPTEIYIKTKPLEWFFDNRLSDSYMENTYTLDGKGTLRVSNRFVNFSQFTDMDKAGRNGQELPAIYIVHPLNYFYCETVEGNIFDPNLSDLPTTQAKTGLSHQVTGSYHYAIARNKLSKDWFAFVNEEKFGVGIYMPNAQSYNASRGCKSSHYQNAWNTHYDRDLYDFSGYKYIPSAYTNNYNYLSAASALVMMDFVPLEYDYAVYVGTVEEMRSVFAKLYAENAIPNQGFKVWDRY